MHRQHALHHPLAAYFALTFAISWGVWLPLAASSHGLLTVPLPADVLWFAGGWGPTLAALVLTGITGGAKGIRAFLARALEWRVGLRWYLVAILTPATLALSALGLHRLLGGSVSGPALAPLTLAPMVYLTSLPSGPLSEEFGWRGYALPLLQGRQGSLLGSLSLGIVWSLWHLPLFYIRGTSQAGTSFFWFSVQGVALAFLLTWLYNRTRGSLLPIILLHAAVNSSFAVFPIMPTVAGEPRPYLLNILLTVVVAALIAVSWLSERRRAACSAAGSGRRNP